MACNFKNSGQFYLKICDADMWSIFSIFSGIKIQCADVSQFSKKSLQRYTFIFLTKKDRYFLPGCCWNMIFGLFWVAKLDFVKTQSGWRF